MKDNGNEPVDELDDPDELVGDDPNRAHNDGDEHGLDSPDVAPEVFTEGDAGRDGVQS